MAATGGSGITTGILVGATSTSLCTKNSSRRFVLITNNAASGTVYVGFGTNNAATTNMIPIPAQGNLLLGPSAIVTGNQAQLPAGDIAGIVSGSSIEISITEY